jgi:hypothetical protein
MVIFRSFLYVYISEVFPSSHPTNSSHHSCHVTCRYPVMFPSYLVVHWDNNGYYMDTIWIIYGYYMDHKWKQLMDHILIYGLHVSQLSPISFINPLAPPSPFHITYKQYV